MYTFGFALRSTIDFATRFVLSLGFYLRSHPIFALLIIVLLAVSVSTNELSDTYVPAGTYDCVNVAYGKSCFIPD